MIGMARSTINPIEKGTSKQKTLSKISENLRVRSSNITFREDSLNHIYSLTVRRQLSFPDSVIVAEHFDCTQLTTRCMLFTASYRAKISLILHSSGRRAQTGIEFVPDRDDSSHYSFVFGLEKLS